MKEVNVDVASEILNLTKDIYNFYMRSPEQLQKVLTGLFFDRLEVKNKVMIKYCYTPFFAELMRVKTAFYKTLESEKAVDINAKSNFIIRDTLGA